LDAPAFPNEHTIQENFITSETNVVHLFSSTEILLKVPSYTVFFDANVYPSIEGYLKDKSLDGLDVGLLYKAKLGINLLQKIVPRYPNLIILPPVAEEIDHLTSADLSQIRRKREFYDRLPTGGKNEALDAHNRLSELAGLITGLRQAVKDKAHAAPEMKDEIYRPILSLVKFLDENLGTKKPESREFNDTDERLVASAFYQMLYENRNAAVYTRDEDVKRLVSTTFRFLMFLATKGRTTLARKLEFTNIIVFKYNYEKGVFQRYFESHTTPHPEDFIFPSRLRDQEKSAIQGGAQELTVEIERAIGSTSGAVVEPQREKPSTGGGEKALRHIAALILDDGRFAPADSEAEVSAREHDLEQLQVLGQFFGAKEVTVQVEAALEELRHSRIEGQIRKLEGRGHELEAELARFTVPSGAGLDFDFSRRLSKVAGEVNDNLLERLFLSMAIEEKRLNVSAADLGRIRAMLQKLEKSGYDLHREEVCLPLEEIEALMGIPADRIVQVVQTRKIRHEGRRVFLDLKGLTRLFIVGSL
jgi:hypothetical protein